MMVFRAEPITSRFVVIHVGKTLDFENAELFSYLCHDTLAQGYQNFILGRTDIHFGRPIGLDFTRVCVAFFARCAASRSKSALIRPKSNANRFLHSECQYALVLCQSHNDGLMAGRFCRRQGA